MKVVGLIDLSKKLDSLENLDIQKGIRKGALLIEQVARAYAPVHDGQLRTSITSWVETEGESVRGIAAPNAAYAMYVEFGTGPKGAADHSGISPNITPAYTMEPWWIHEGPGENEISRETAEFYHFPFIETDKGRFYRCSGQAAQPFMYPAYKDCEEEVIEIIKSTVKEHINETR